MALPFAEGVVFASVAQEGNTKVALQSDAKSFYWEPGDQIKVFLATLCQHYKKTLSAVLDHDIAHPQGLFHNGTELVCRVRYALTVRGNKSDNRGRSRKHVCEPLPAAGDGSVGAVLQF